jgi:hypothetical protein
VDGRLLRDGTGGLGIGFSVVSLLLAMTPFLALQAPRAQEVPSALATSGWVESDVPVLRRP